MHNLTAASEQPDVHFFFLSTGLVVGAGLGSGLLTLLGFCSKLLKCCFYFVSRASSPPSVRSTEKIKHKATLELVCVWDYNSCLRMGALVECLRPD